MNPKAPLSDSLLHDSSRRQRYKPTPGLVMQGMAGGRDPAKDYGNKKYGEKERGYIPGKL